MDVLELTARFAPEIVALRRRIHRNPEVAWQEHETCALVKQELDRMGIPYRSCGGETGILAEICGGREGKTVLLRADMDALKVQEMADVEYASEKNGYMHACGHDGHTAMLLGAAMALHSIKAELAGRVLLAFQPAEEVAAGAVAMIEDGALEGVDACFGMHLMTGVDAGTVLIPDEYVLSAADQFRIDVEGLGGHASQPHTAVDAVVTAAAIVTALQTIVSRETNPQEAGVVTIGRMEAGTLFNAIAATAVLEGTVRTYRDDVREHIEDAVKRIAEGTAAAYRAKATCDYRRFCKATWNDPARAKQLRESAAEVFGVENVRSNGRLMISEDFSEFALRVPSAFALVGIYDESCDAVYPNHNGKFCFDEGVLTKGAALYAKAAMDFLAE
ncbi:MAG: amidohydrolase [Oscillospiraceae bacterium]|nr:amidohydrolase [Oscillospiraceae bacterium]